MKRKQKDRIDVLVDDLDKFYFRLGQAENVLNGNTYTRTADHDSIRLLFRTAQHEAAQKLFYENLEEVKDVELAHALDEAAIDWRSREDDFSVLLGFVLGLRIAGMSSEQTKAMARTWRLGYPQDDPS